MMLYTKEKKTLPCFNLNVLFHSIRFATKYELPLHKLVITTQIGYYYTNWLLLHKLVIPTQIGYYYTNCYYYTNSLLLHKFVITTQIHYYCTLNESTNN